MNTVEKIKKICKDRKIPVSRLEKDLGFANGYISQLKKGTIPYDRLLKICKYLDIPIEFFDADLQIEVHHPNPERTGRIVNAYAHLLSGAGMLNPDIPNKIVYSIGSGKTPMHAKIVYELVNELHNLDDTDISLLLDMAKRMKPKEEIPKVDGFTLNGAPPIEQIKRELDQDNDDEDNNVG